LKRRSCPEFTLLYNESEIGIRPFSQACRDQAEEKWARESRPGPGQRQSGNGRESRHSGIGVWKCRWDRRGSIRTGDREVSFIHIPPGFFQPSQISLDDDLMWPVFPVWAPRGLNQGFLWRIWGACLVRLHDKQNGRDTALPSPQADPSPYPY